MKIFLKKWKMNWKFYDFENFLLKMFLTNFSKKILRYWYILLKIYIFTDKFYDIGNFYVKFYDIEIF